MISLPRGLGKAWKCTRWGNDFGESEFYRSPFCQTRPPFAYITQGYVQVFAAYLLWAAACWAYVQVFAATQPFRSPYSSWHQRHMYGFNHHPASLERLVCLEHKRWSSVTRFSQSRQYTLQS